MVLTPGSIFEQFDPLSPEDRDQCCVSLEQEVILSYRLLFGQDGNSRKLAREELCQLKNKYTNQKVDSMLYDLCERKYEHGSLWWKTYDKVLQLSIRDMANHMSDHGRASPAKRRVQHSR